MASSILTAEFNHRRLLRHQQRANDSKKELETLVGNGNVTTQQYPRDLAYFDARCFTIPDRTEVMNYFIWRNQDCNRNSISMVSQYHFSHKELHGKSTKDQLKMLCDKGVNYEEYYTLGEKYGRIISKELYQVTNDQALMEGKCISPGVSMFRTKWKSQGAWKFTDGKQKLLLMIPEYK